MLWENEHHQGTDGQSKETAFPHPSSLRKNNGKAEPKPGGSHNAELCWTPSTAGGIRVHHSRSFSEVSLEKQTHILCLSWLYQSGGSAERASELGNTNKGEWGIQDAHGHPLKALISGKQLRQSMENSCVWLQDHASVLTSDEFTPKPLPSPVTLF